MSAIFPIHKNFQAIAEPAKASALIGISLFVAFLAVSIFYRSRQESTARLTMPNRLNFQLVGFISTVTYACLKLEVLKKSIFIRTMTTSFGGLFALGMVAKPKSKQASLAFAGECALLSILLMRRAIQILTNP